MSVKRISPRETQTPLQLVTAIAEELKRNQPDGPADAPQITEEEVPYSKSLFVTVIWDAWRELGKDVRGRVIMDAYKQVRPDEVPNISLVLGLTHAEAVRLKGVPRLTGGSRHE